MSRNVYLLCAILCLCYSAEAHSKLYCTKLILDGSGNPSSCQGWLNTDSVYVHIWGPGEPGGKFNNRNLPYPSECSLQDVREGRQTTWVGTNRQVKVTTGTGTPPPISRMAQVRPGETITILWSLNNHGGPNNILWEGRGPLDVNTPEPSYDDWTNPARRIARLPYRDTEGPVRCSNFVLGQGVLGSIMASQPRATWDFQHGLSEMRACWGQMTIPANMPAGTNRLLYEWVSPPNDGRFYDTFWVNVAGGGGGGGGGATPPVSTGNAFGIHWVKDVNRVIDVAGGQNANGVKLLTWTNAGPSANQRFVLTGCNQINWQGTNKCIDATGQDRNGVQVHMWDCDCNNPNQKFELNNARRIKWRGHNKCLDVSGGNPNPGTAINLWDCMDGNVNQQFSMIPIGGRSITAGAPAGSNIGSASLNGKDPVYADALVFDYLQYQNKYPDLKNAFNGNAQGLVDHWYSSGMKECRQSRDSFSAQDYLNRYADLKQVFGDDCASAVSHFVRNGNSEGRSGNPAGAAVSVEVPPQMTFLSYDNGDLTARLTLWPLASATGGWKFYLNLSVNNNAVLSTSAGAAAVVDGQKLTVSGTGSLPDNVTVTLKFTGTPSDGGTYLPQVVAASLVSADTTTEMLVSSKTDLEGVNLEANLNPAINAASSPATTLFTPPTGTPTQSNQPSPTQSSQPSPTQSNQPSPTAGPDTVTALSAAMPTATIGSWLMLTAAAGVFSL